MHFNATSLPGVWLIDLELREDERGFFARTYCEDEFEKHGLNTGWPQCNLTFTKRRGMLRGLHYQTEPKPEIKLIRCIAGTIWDVLVDVRRESSTFGKWEAFELAGNSPRQLYVPGGYAHGFQCLTDDCQVFYQMSESYAPELARGVRWNDPQFSIKWPLSDEAILAPRDAGYPNFTS